MKKVEELDRWFHEVLRTILVVGMALTGLCLWLDWADGICLVILLVMLLIVAAGLTLMDARRDQFDFREVALEKDAADAA